jgi:hypothetical protein
MPGLVARLISRFRPPAAVRRSSRPPAVPVRPTRPFGQSLDRNETTDQFMRRIDAEEAWCDQTDDRMTALEYRNVMLAKTVGSRTEVLKHALSRLNDDDDYTPGMAMTYGHSVATSRKAIAEAKSQIARNLAEMDALRRLEDSTEV